MLVEVIRGGKKHFKSKTFSSSQEAKNWEKKMLYEIDMGILTPENLKKRYFHEVIDRYIKLILPNYKRNYRNVLQHLNWWKRQLGNYLLNEVSPPLVANCRDILLNEPNLKGKKRAPATVVRYLASLSIVFEAAIKEWHWIEKNPVRLIKKPVINNARQRFLSEEECKSLLENCEKSSNSFLYPIVVLALFTGMRRREILNLTWEDIDFEKNTIRLRYTKNGSTRYVPMPRIVSATTKKLFESETIIDKGFYLFSGINPDKEIDIRSAWRHCIKRADLSGLRFHDLRHSCASFLAMSGANQRDIAEILGHKDIRMTHRYSHLTQKHLAEALEKAESRMLKK